MAYGFSGPGGFRIGRMRHIEMDVPDLVAPFPEHHHFLGRLKYHERTG